MLKRESNGALYQPQEAMQHETDAAHDASRKTNVTGCGGGVYTQSACFGSSKLGAADVPVVTKPQHVLLNSISNDTGYTPEQSQRRYRENSCCEESENHIWFMNSDQPYVHNVRCLKPPALTRAQFDYAYTQTLCSRGDSIIYLPQGPRFVAGPLNAQATTGEKEIHVQDLKLPSPCSSLSALFSLFGESNAICLHLRKQFFVQWRKKVSFQKLRWSVLVP